MLAGLRLAAVLAGLALLAALLVPMQLLLIGLGRGNRAVLPKLFHRGFLFLIGVRRRVHGRPASGGVLYVSNHVSWSDIPLLGAELGAAFVAKSEVASWPIVGVLARAHGIIFVNRERTRLAQDQAASIAAWLHRGEGVILFPEGTTSGGETLLPFKTTLFAAADAGEGDMVIQPVSLAYTRIGGRPIDAADRQAISWVGDESLLPHALHLLGLPSVTAELIFHPPIRRGDFADRKALASHCREAIADGLAVLNGGQAANRSA